MGKTAIRTEAAPAPFQGAPYNQAIGFGDLVFVAGQIGLRPEERRREGDVTRADDATAGQRRGDPRGSRKRALEDRQDDRLPDRPRRLQGDERRLCGAHRGAVPGEVDDPGRGPARRARRRDRGDRAPVGRGLARECARADRDPPFHPLARARRVRRRRRRARRATRDRAFRRGLSRPGRRPGRPSSPARGPRPGRGHGGSRPARRRPASIPATTPVRKLVPAGIELTPPRKERSTGPGHRDFEIVADPDIVDRGRHGAPRLHRQRHGPAARDRRARRPVRRSRRPRRAACCGRSRPESFREDPLRILRGLRLVSQLDFTLGDATLAQMRAEAPGLAPCVRRADRRRSRRRRHGRAFEAAARDAACASPCGSRATRARSSR